ncbi:MAG: Rrf2 family transcriptional regulator [Gammaproteobacteria bacterium]|nr:Rrf2 family transcriptional regulator [Gammaproteobacteria bacterium]
MKLSTKGRYAVTAMLDLAINAKTGPVTLSDISVCQDISLSYLEQLMSLLRQQKLVKGMRGPGGGYMLSRPADEITIAEIITAVDESVDVTRCKGNEDCQGGVRCLTHELWDELSHQLYHFLDGITLARYVNRPDVQHIINKQERPLRPANLITNPQTV